MNNNWEKLGDEIRKTVQDAVENQNYERLNQMISETLNKAAKSATDTVKNKYNGYKTYTTDFEHAKRASREAFGSYQGKKQVPVKIQTKLPSKIGNIALTVLGYSLGGIEFIWLMFTLAATFFRYFCCGRTKNRYRNCFCSGSHSVCFGISCWNYRNKENVSNQSISGISFSNW